MDKAQALYDFWASFGLPAYDETNIPDDAVMPYITYNTVTDSIDNVVPLSGSIWYRSTSWAEISHKSDEIAKKVAEHGYYITTAQNGYLWLTKGQPFAQRIANEDRSVRQIYINITGEFLTSY